MLLSIFVILHSLEDSSLPGLESWLPHAGKGHSMKERMLSSVTASHFNWTNESVPISKGVTEVHRVFLICNLNVLPRFSAESFVDFDTILGDFLCCFSVL